MAGSAAQLTLASGCSYRTTDQDTLRSRNRSISAARQPRASETGDQGSSQVMEVDRKCPPADNQWKCSLAARRLACPLNLT
jgi:hypothetical protein